MFVVDLFRSLPIGERTLLMDSLLLRAHPEASALAGEVLTTRHLEFLKMFDERRLATSGQWKYIPLRFKRGYRKLFNAQGRPLPPEASEGDFCDELPAKIDRRVLFNELKSKLDAGVWSKLMNCGAGEWQCSALVRGTSVSLNLDFGGSSDQLGYWHDVGGVARFLSIGQWLGVGSLAWDLCTVRDSAAVANAVGNLVNEFIENVPVVA